MDNRVINVGYSVVPMRLFVCLTELCMDDEVLASPPRVMKDGCTIVQTYGECPHSGGAEVFYRVNKKGQVLVFEPEVVGFKEEYKDEDASHTWDITSLRDNLKKLMVGDL